jgi:hypothetical protein
LNFLQEKYENEHVVTFKNPSQALQAILRETGPLPNDEERPKKKAGAAAARKSSSNKYDYEKIADALEKLEEDDLLRVIQIINDNKTPDTYIKSDVDGRWPLDYILFSFFFLDLIYPPPDLQFSVVIYFILFSVPPPFFFFFLDPKPS